MENGIIIPESVVILYYTQETSAMCFNQWIPANDFFSRYEIGLIRHPAHRFADCSALIKATNSATSTTMRIATLQFSPVLGHVEENIALADSLLSSSSPSLHHGLDLLVLPELAFTGLHHHHSPSNPHSHISPQATTIPPSNP